MPLVMQMKVAGSGELPNAWWAIPTGHAELGKRQWLCENQCELVCGNCCVLLSCNREATFGLMALNQVIVFPLSGHRICPHRPARWLLSTFCLVWFGLWFRRHRPDGLCAWLWPNQRSSIESEQTNPIWDQDAFSFVGCCVSLLL